MNPRSSSATGSSFLSLIAVMAFVEPVAPVGRGGLSHGRPSFSEPARDLVLRRQRERKRGSVVPHRAVPVEAAWLAAGVDYPWRPHNRTSRRAPRPGIPTADGEVFMVGIDSTCTGRSSFICTSSRRWRWPASARLEIGKQQVGFLHSTGQDRVVRLERRSSCSYPSG